MNNITPLENAKKLNNNTLLLNHTAVIDSWGSVGAKKIMYICGPLANNGKESLHDCYKSILATAEKIGAKTVLIPSFSTGPGGYDCHQAALIAVSEISQFLAGHPDMKVFVVTYKNDQAKDEKNWCAYNEIFKKNCCPQLSLQEGEIQKMPGDVIVVPVSNHFSSPGAVAKAVDQAAAIPNIDQIFSIMASTINIIFKPLKKVPAPSNNLVCTTNVLPDDVLHVIFSRLSIKDLGRLAQVCKRFNGIQNYPGIWLQIANDNNYDMDVNKDIKSQVRDAKIKLEYGQAKGTLNLLNKSFSFEVPGKEIDSITCASSNANDFIALFSKAITLLPKDYYIKFYHGYGSSCYIYRDKQGTIKQVYSESRMDMGSDPVAVKIIDNLTTNQKKLTLIGSDGKTPYHDLLNH